MKKALLFLILSMCGITLASPINSMLGADGIELSADYGIPEVDVEYIEFDGSQFVTLDDIAPIYYTQKYVVLDYQLTGIFKHVVQRIGTSSCGVTLCTGGGYVQTENTGIKADLDRHIIVIDGVTYPYQVFYDEISILSIFRSSNTIRRFTLGGVERPNGIGDKCWMRFYGMTISDSADSVPNNNFVPCRIGDIGLIKDEMTGRLYFPSSPVIIGPDLE